MVSVDEDHEIVSVSEKPFTSLPLFLPSDVAYDPETNTISNKSDDAESKTSTEAPQLVLVPNAGVEMLESLHPKDVPISLISCVGPYRTGKSLLVSRFLENSNAFQIGPTLEGCTRGIWISTSVLKQKSNGVYKFVLDCEGMGDPLSATGAESNAINDVRIALACVLLSTVFVFNNTSHPDRGSLQFLRYLDTIRKRIPVSKSRIKYPSFLWVFRDFFLQLPMRKDDPTRKYTLEEYMLERVLNQKHSGEDAEVVDSLLNDFADFNVLSIGYPKRQEGRPFSAEEMSMLGDVPWNEFDEDFQKDMNNVIKHCLEEAATPFSLGNEKSKGVFNWSPRSAQKLGAYASPAAYAKWCETCLELVNSEGVIPNLPDLQHQLLQTMAEDQVNKCIETYRTVLQEFLDASDVYNIDKQDIKHIAIGEGKHATTLPVDVDFNSVIEEKQLKGVADADNLLSVSLHTSEKLRKQLEDSISSPSILKDTLEIFENKCDGGNKSSFLSQIQQENFKRSQQACEALAQRIYAPIRKVIRDDPTKVKVSDFETKVIVEVKEYFIACARGPALDETLLQCIEEPGDADHVFLAKVQERQGLLDRAIETQASLEKDIQEKLIHLASLENDLNETMEKNQKEIEKMRADHTSAMEKAIAEQKKREEEQLAALELEMQRKLKAAEESLEKSERQRALELDNLKSESEERLRMEISAREERMKNEQLAYEAELQQVKSMADKKLDQEIRAAEDRRLAEQERIKTEMEAKIAEAEKKMEEEIKRKQEALARAEEAMALKEKENSELMERAEIAENQACPVVCCCM
eukprot:scaffold2751_cov131-Cylindrotheca_fusiformis.AAC.17